MLTLIESDESPLMNMVREKEDLERRKRELERQIKANARKMRKFIVEQTELLGKVRG